MASVPRLVVLVSYDQYRGDYPGRFAGIASTRGFNRIANEGTTFQSCYYDHANLMTGPGHAVLLTGCYPHRSGVPANDVCDVASGRCFYCAEDSTHGLAPMLLRVPTIGDLLRAKNPASRVIGIAMKDRAAILMAGHDPSAVLWFDPTVLGFTTSTYYHRPPWLALLNGAVRADVYAGHTWRAGIPDSLRPAADDVEGEGAMRSGRRTFPHRLPGLTDTAAFVDDFIRTPYSVTYLFDAAREILRRERLGQDSVPDLLCIGVSNTDYVGHTFGPDSREVQEMYRACDTTLANLIEELDHRVGREHYVLIVTSDHGVCPIPELVRRLGPPGVAVDAGRFSERAVGAAVDSALTARYGRPSGRWIRRIMEPAVVLADAALAERGVDRAEAAEVARSATRSVEGVLYAVTHRELVAGQRPPSVDAADWHRILNSFDADRSGDVVFYPRRYWLIGPTPASHGTPHDYDRFVPLMLLGGGIPASLVTETVSPADIAPTLAKWLDVDLGTVDGAVLPLDGP